MPVAWYPKRWWNFYMLEDEKKEIQPIFIEYSAFNVYNLRVLKHFDT